MAWSTSAVVAVLTCLPGPVAGLPKPAAASRTVEVRRADLDEFALKAGGVTFNNFQSDEHRAKDYPDAGWEHAPHALTVRGTYRNATADAVAFTLVVVGLDADRELLWACHIPGQTDSNGVGVFTATATVPGGTLGQTVMIRVRARVGSSPLLTTPFPTAR